jgi:hypothetical protein
MDESIRTAAISPLRQRLIDDMNIRRFSRETQHNYIRDVGRFATFLGLPPPVMTSLRSAENRNTHRPSSAAREFIPQRLSYSSRRPKLFTNPGQRLGGAQH